MNGKISNCGLPIVLAALLGLLWAAGLAGSSKAAGPLCSVDDDGPADYATIEEALADGGCTTIEVAAGVYTENLTIDRDVSLLGEGAGITVIDGDGPVTHKRVISITFQQHVRIADLTIQNGHAVSGINGGGGISNRGHLTVTRVTLTDNVVDGTGDGDIGGAISPGGIGSGSLRMVDCVVSHNSARRGGGIFFNNTLWMTNTLIYSNTAYSGGGIVNYGAMTLTNVTLSNNASNNSGGGINNNRSAMVVNSTIAENVNQGIRSSGTITLTNTLLADNTGNNCYGDVVSLGYNLDSGNSCHLGSTGDITDTDALLAALQDNGGPTWTHALLAGSPAIDAGSDAACPAVDQRGVIRPVDGNMDGAAACDIGAYEFEWLQSYLPLLSNP